MNNLTSNPTATIIKKHRSEPNQFRTAAAISPNGYNAVEQLPNFVNKRWNTEVDKLSAHVRLIINILKDYVVKMDPTISSITESEKARQQTQLYKAFINALSTPLPEDSLIALNIIMFFIAGHKSTVFSYRNALTAVDIMRLDSNENRVFRSLVVLFINTCDPVTRTHVLRRHTDLNKVIGALPTVEMQQALKRFYSINL